MTEKEFELMNRAVTVNNIELSVESFKENLEKIFEGPDGFENDFDKLVERINTHHFSKDVFYEISKRIECFETLREFIEYINRLYKEDTDFINRNKDKDIQLLEFIDIYRVRIIDLMQQKYQFGGGYEFDPNDVEITDH